MEKFDVEGFMRKMKLVVLVAILFAVIGIILHVTAFTLEFQQFAPLLDEYYGQNSKIDRDAAQAGSELALMEAEVAKFPPKLMTFKLVGVGSILVGIFLTLFVIVQVLRIMPIRLGEIIKKK